MRFFRAAVCALLILLPLACAADRPNTGTKANVSSDDLGTVPVLLAAWNVANLFDTVDSPNDDIVLRAEQWDRKIDEVAAVVQSLDADFLALVEVENLDCLHALNQALASPYPQCGLIEGNDNRGIDVAFLSRLPVDFVTSHKDHDLPQVAGVSKNYKFSRDCLEVGLATDPPATILVNHFKSQLGGKKEAAAKRYVQAQGVVEIAANAAEQRPEGFEMVMGDLNDRPGSWSLEPLTLDFCDAFSGWPENLRATHRSKQGNSSLDHILISRDAEGRLQEPKVWKNLGKPTSDHDPVSVVLKLDRKPAVPGQAKTWSRGD
jgi:endonuclease/exonuclease/phosphatase family metal-dependent hydrolase